MTSEGEPTTVALDAASEFAAFLHGRGPALQRTAFLLTGDWALAEDLLQVALAKSHLAWSRIRHDDPEGYVRKVLANTHASWWRRKWRGPLPRGPHRGGRRTDPRHQRRHRQEPDLQALATLRRHPSLLQGDLA